ncbi:MAG: hypothetical protein P4L86_30425, partial [Mycobacterium sp.]|nr:hypothetical protein [Mycobacterium sp.]
MASKALRGNAANGALRRTASNQRSASSGSSAPANARVEEIRQHFSELAGDVQALSHQLHSSKLDYLG